MTERSEQIERMADRLADIREQIAALYQEAVRGLYESLDNDYDSLSHYFKGKVSALKTVLEVMGLSDAEISELYLAAACESSPLLKEPATLFKPAAPEAIEPGDPVVFYEDSDGHTMTRKAREGEPPQGVVVDGEHALKFERIE